MPANPGATQETQAPAGAAEGGHAYSRIALRNAFGIKPPPPPPPVMVPSNPPVTLPMFLTGFSVLKGVKQAFLVINRPGSKQPDYVTAREGEEFEGFKVLAIDPKKETVRVVNGATEAMLNFKDNGMKATAGPVAPLPGAMPNAPGGVPQPRQLGAPAAAGAGGGPTIIGRNNAAQNAAIAAPAASYTVGQTANVQPVELRGRSGVITGGTGGSVTPTPTTGGHVPVPRTRPPLPPLPGQ